MCNGKQEYREIMFIRSSLQYPEALKPRPLHTGYCNMEQIIFNALFT